MNLLPFPSDGQKCKLVFELQEYWPTEIRMKESTWVEHFKDFNNEEWDFISIDDRPTKFTYYKYSREKSNISGVVIKRREDAEAVGFNVTIHLHRNPSFYMYSFLVNTVMN